MFLLGVIALLAVADAALWIHSVTPQDGGLSVVFTSAPLRAADDVPISVALRSTDNAVHEDVRMTWHLPEWAEIVRAEPPISKDGSILFGRVAPGINRTSLIVVHIRALPGVHVPFDVSVRQTNIFGLHQSVNGELIRTIVSSALVIQPPAVIHKASAGASIPVVVTNTGSANLASIALRVTGGLGTIDGKSVGYVGSLAPGASTTVFIDVPLVDSMKRLSWQADDQARIVAAASTSFPIGGTFPMLVGAPSLSDDHGTLRIPYTTPSNMHGAFFVTIQDSNGRRINLPLVNALSKNDVVSVPIPSGAAASAIRWSVLPVIIEPDGSWWIGRRTSQSVSASIPFHTEARYYSTSGDQLGVGPLAPIIGASTRFWVVWSVDPGPDGLRDVKLAGRLPRGVLPTGSFASTISGSFAHVGGWVTWSIPFIPPSGGAGPVTFAFEAEINPTRLTPTIASASGKTLYQLVATSTIEAFDASTGMSLHATSSGDDSRWANDVTAQSRMKH